MKKILQINILNETGSTGRIMQGISKSLQNSGYEVYTAYGYGKSTLPNSIKLGNKASYIYHNLSSKLWCSQGLYSKKSTKKLIDFIEKNKIDLIHLHNIHGNYINYVLLFNYIKKNNIPIIWTLHDCWPFTGKCTYFDSCHCEKWKSECGNCPILNEYPKSYFLDRTNKYFKLKKEVFSSVNKMFFVSPSEWLKTLFKQSFLNNYPIYVINNGINMSIFKPTENNLKKKFGLENKKIILGVASPWSKRKGYNDFITLSSLLDNSYQIVMIGVSDIQKRELQGTKIIAIERTENIQELVMWYSVADVFINLTYEDNFPTVNLESLACGTPIITYATGGSIEVINQNTGIICEQGNLYEVKKNIEYICENKSQFSSCFSFIRNKFDEKKTFNNYIFLYDEILKEE